MLSRDSVELLLEMAGAEVKRGEGDADIVLICIGALRGLPDGVEVNELYDIASHFR